MDGELKGKILGLNFDIPYFEPGRILHPTGNQEVDEATRRNAATLYRQAEAMKKRPQYKTRNRVFFLL